MTAATRSDALALDENFLQQVSATSQVSTTKTAWSSTSRSISQEVANQLSRQCTTIDKDLEAVVSAVLVRRSIEAAVAECKFVVTIADPRAKDCPLIAVSTEFENLTGFRRHEILGVNCRFLNQGCDMNPEDLMALRECSRTGAPYTAVIPNRKKSGELFLNLLDVRGLNVARDRKTGEMIWFLIGIQADVTELAEEEVPPDHLQDLQNIASAIRSGITKELSKMAIAGSHGRSMELPELREQMDGCDWELLSTPEWREDPEVCRRRSPRKLTLTIAEEAQRQQGLEEESVDDALRGGFGALAGAAGQEAPRRGLRPDVGATELSSPGSGASATLVGFAAVAAIAGVCVAVLQSRRR